VPAGALLVAAPAAWHLVTFARVLAARLAYAMDFEWMESGHIYAAYRVLHGLPLYTDPATGYAPFPYPPLYWYAIAAVAKVTSLDWWTGRAVSDAT